jgi:hypothetical protein
MHDSSSLARKNHAKAEATSSLRALKQALQRLFKSLIESKMNGDRLPLNSSL